MYRESLASRLQHLSQSTSPDSGDHVLFYLRKLFQMPFCNYMRNHPKKQNKILNHLSIPACDVSTITYGDVASKIYSYLNDISDPSDKSQTAPYYEMLGLISTPVFFDEGICYEEVPDSYDMDFEQPKRIPLHVRLSKFSTLHMSGVYDATIFDLKTKDFLLGMSMLSKKYTNPAWQHFDRSLRELLSGVSSPDSFDFNSSDLTETLQDAKITLPINQMAGLLLHVFILPFIELNSLKRRTLNK